MKYLTFCLGELEVANARNVLLYTTSGKISNDDGFYGLLCVTNFKLSFLTAGNVTVRITQGKYFVFSYVIIFVFRMNRSYIKKIPILVKMT